MSILLAEARDLQRRINVPALLSAEGRRLHREQAQLKALMAQRGLPWPSPPERGGTVMM